MGTLVCIAILRIYHHISGTVILTSRLKSVGRLKAGRYTIKSAICISKNGPDIIPLSVKPSIAKLREIFKEAKDNSPSIIFIDEMDAIAPKREDVYGDVEKRVVAQLLALMDGLTDRGNVIVLGATNRRDSIDPALRRPGRFDREVEITVPDSDGRYEVLQIHTRGMPIAKGVDLKDLASDLHGYTGADIKSLCREAAMKSIRRYIPQIDLETEKIPYGVLQSMEIKIIDFYMPCVRSVCYTVLLQFYVHPLSPLTADLVPV